MDTFIDGFVVVRNPYNDEYAPINRVMAGFTREEDAKAYVEECYRDDYNEFCSDCSEDAYDLYRERPVNGYSVIPIPMLVRL